MNHTPTPWNAVLSTVYRMDQRGFIDEENIICSVINRPDAAFIVRAINSHEEMIEILKELQDIPEINPSNYDHDEVCAMNAELCNLWARAKEVIAKAEGK